MLTQTKATPQTVELVADGHHVYGTLSVPARATGLILFAHGSGSSRHSPRNQFVAERLQQAGMATLLFDLLDEAEANDRQQVFDIELLAQRLQLAAAWMHDQPATRELPLGYFGASTGAAAALVAAAAQPQHIAAVVSRGGRPDLAADALARVAAPTLLIAGGEDHTVLQLNRQALQQLRCPKELAIVPGATHLFEEPGTLEQAARLAAEWFQNYLPAGGSESQ